MCLGRELNPGQFASAREYISITPRERRWRMNHETKRRASLLFSVCGRVLLFISILSTLPRFEPILVRGFYPGVYWRFEPMIVMEFYQQVNSREFLWLPSASSFVCVCFWLVGSHKWFCVCFIVQPTVEAGRVKSTTFEAWQLLVH